MPVLNDLVLLFARKRLKAMDAFRQNPSAVQDKILTSLLSAGRSTLYGREHGFGEISSMEAYQRRVPVSTYERLCPYIDRMRAGEQNVLWSTPVKWFAKSSGTTAAKSKFIPVSAECLQQCHFQGSKDVTLTYLNNYPQSKLLYGKSLTLGGSHQLDESGSGIKYGDLSAIMIQNTPLYLELVRVPPREVALIPDFEQKTAAIAKLVEGQNVVSFAGVPSWNLVMMKRILEHAGKDNLLEIWPNLDVFFHGGVAFSPYREQFRRLIPSDQMHYMETYNASEGFFALQDDPKDDAMLLLLDNAVFYEFIPMSQLNKPFPDALTVADVQLGVNYAMIITTNAGLWRYLIGDTVEFTSLKPHKIKITGRTAHFINVFGEELIAANAEAALSIACQGTGAMVSEYTVAPIFMDHTARGAHEWLIEFEVAPSDPEQFANLLDAALCSVNSDYEAKRANSSTLNRLKLTMLPKGAFYQWMARRGKLGGQNKIPRLYNTREYAEALTQSTPN